MKDLFVKVGFDEVVYKQFLYTIVQRSPANIHARTYYS
jgi:hypothetical protein